MRKLLLLILAPVLVLGVMGCTNKIDAGVQTDEMIQGAWLFEDGDYTLYFSAAQLSVQYITDVLTPYRTEYVYSATNAANGNRYYSGTAPTGTGWAGITIKQGAVDTILGVLTLFNYKNNTEIASVYTGLAIEEQYKDNILTIYNVVYSEAEYYYLDAFPKIGDYGNLYNGEGGTITRPKDPIIKPPVRTTTPRQFVLVNGTIPLGGEISGIFDDPVNPGYGFRITGANLNNEMAKFEISFTPYSLKDIASVEFKYTAIGGDSNNKDINFLAANLLPSGTFTVATYSIGSVASGDASSEKPLKIELNETKAAAITGSTIQISFHISATKTGGSLPGETEYTIKEIIFNVYDD